MRLISAPCLLLVLQITFQRYPHLLISFNNSRHKLTILSIQWLNRLLLVQIQLLEEILQQIIIQTLIIKIFHSLSALSMSSMKSMRIHLTKEWLLIVQSRVSSGQRTKKYLILRILILIIIAQQIFYSFLANYMMITFLMMLRLRMMITSISLIN